MNLGSPPVSVVWEMGRDGSECGQFMNLGVHNPVSVMWEVGCDGSQCGQFMHELGFSPSQHCVGDGP